MRTMRTSSMYFLLFASLAPIFAGCGDTIETGAEGGGDTAAQTDAETPEADTTALADTPEAPGDEGTPVGDEGTRAPEDSGPVPDGGGDGFHPQGWVAPSAHGLAAKMGDQKCTMCHGGDLMGGSSGVGCDDCHPTNWRTNCTFCHGGVHDDTGAPPVDIDDESDGIPFPGHPSHVAVGAHQTYGCGQCHAKPADVLTPGHMFDSTPGQAEVTFAAGLSKAGSYTPGSCSNLYCHGNGQGANGSAKVGDSAATCSSCHAAQESGSTAWNAMSGRHRKHLKEGVKCWDCHSEVVNSTSFANAELHVNGTPNVKMPAGVTMSGNTCNGSCHGEYHSNFGW